jgi:hypothetical protein
MKRIKVKGLLSAGILLITLLLMAGMASAGEALVNTTLFNGTTETYVPTAGYLSNTSQGGYITEINITQLNTQTQNWQGFYGNVTGNIYLKGSAGDSMFNWTVDLTNSYVYATTNDTMNDYDNLVIADPTELDPLWNFSSTITDNIAGTYYSTNDSTFVGNVLTGVSNATTVKGFEDYVIQDVASAPAKNNVLWAATIYDAKPNFKGTDSNFELLVPSESDIYYFYIEV